MKTFFLMAVLLGCDNPPDAKNYPAPPEPCSDAGLCTPPAGGCADQHWLYYYDDGQCQQGACTWETKFYNCSQTCVAKAPSYQNDGGPACYFDPGETAAGYYGP
jgi:hypothetical protein